MGRNILGLASAPVPWRPSSAVSITSAKNAGLVEVSSLLRFRKTRAARGLVPLEGLRLVHEALSRGFRPETVVYTEAGLVTPQGGLAQAVRDLLGGECGRAMEVPEPLMRKVSDLETSQGVIAVFPTPEVEPRESPSLVLVCDGVSDAGNLGSLLRSAGGAGVDEVWLSRGCVDLWNPKTLRAGMGVHFSLPIVPDMAWKDMTQRADKLGMRVWLADGGPAKDGSAATRYDRVAWTEPSACVLCSEAHGPSEEARELAHGTVCIPMSGDCIESLNCAMAGSVLLYEAARQRAFPSVSPATK